MAILLTLAVGLIFGAADQYLGSRSMLGLWASTVSGLSAAWLVLPFLCGATQERARRATLLGLLSVLAALAGYFAMTYSPVEGVALHRFWSGEVAMVRSGYNPAYVVAGLVLGPLYGWLGQRWRVHRSLLAAAFVVIPLCFEPLAWLLVNRPLRSTPVEAVEIAAGIAAGAIFVLVRAKSSASGRSASGSRPDPR